MEGKVELVVQKLEEAHHVGDVADDNCVHDGRF
jgi:hypothetical protein